MRIPGSNSREPSRRTQLYTSPKCHTGAYGFTDFKWDSNAAQTSPPVKSPTWPNEPSGRSDHEDFPEKGVDVHVDPAEEILAFELSSDSMTGNSPVKFSAPVTRFRPRASNYRTDKARGARAPACLCILSAIGPRGRFEVKAAPVRSLASRVVPISSHGEWQSRTPKGSPPDWFPSLVLER